MLVKPVRGIHQLSSNYNLYENTLSNPLAVFPSESSPFQGISPKKFIKEEIPTFYLCRYTSGEHICQGIIAKIDCGVLNERIIKHEECYIEKITEFHKNFSESNFQTAPTLIFHKDNFEIEANVNCIMRSKKADLTFYIHQCKYELWRTPDNQKFKELYNSIEKFYIADGHHRISHLCNLQMSALAYIVPENHLRTYPIVRKYHEQYNFQLKYLLEDIKREFFLKVISKRGLVPLQENNFILSHNMQKLHISPSNSAEHFQQILSIFSSINFTPEGKLNFKNHKNEMNDVNFEKVKIIKSNKTLNQFNFHLYIPAITPKIIYTTLNKPLPIHSTWFEPKIPSGIIGMELRDSAEDIPIMNEW